MGEYEPNDSRNVTQSDTSAPGEPERTGPREGETRERSQERQEEERRRTAGVDGERTPGPAGEAPGEQAGYGSGETADGAREDDMARRTSGGSQSQGQSQG
ncbi:hypothetical protein [Qipengyuania sp. JC766]|uniref:hypothetical protein n=1 Tax=Qipengyuania sp. JC766 TaxID=3232139 RepID=UPI0034593CC8